MSYAKELGDNAAVANCKQGAHLPTHAVCACAAKDLSRAKAENEALKGQIILLRGKLAGVTNELERVKGFLSLKPHGESGLFPECDEEALFDSLKWVMYACAGMGVLLVIASIWGSIGR